LELRNTDIDVIRDFHIVNFEREFKGFYGHSIFSTYSDDVKLALFDMIFNLGLTKLSSTFVYFNVHIKAGDFKKWALESNRHQLSTDRNFYVRNLLSIVK
jgi:GH24 family phage-related lysozyme (muramidase)